MYMDTLCVFTEHLNAFVAGAIDMQCGVWVQAVSKVLMHAATETCTGLTYERSHCMLPPRCRRRDQLM